MPRAHSWQQVTFTSHSFSGALLSLAAVIAPVALVASSSAGSAQTPTSDPIAAPALVVEPPAASLPDPAPAADPAHVACVAKIILHEAAYEPRTGRVAVAQVIRARIRSGRFAADACAVARQRGQFFNVDAFDPPKNAAWDDAVAIAAETLTGAGEDVVPGALFFHASYSPMPGHERVGRIGGHVFYR